VTSYMISNSLICSTLANWRVDDAVDAPAEYETRDVRILSFGARITAEASLLRDLERLLPPGPAWATAGTHSSTWYQVLCDVPGPGHYMLVRDGEQRRWFARRQDLLLTLVWAIHQAAAEHLRTQYLFFHAGAAAFHGRGFLFPAASGSGKSTLVAGLVAAGFDYFTDDIVTIDPSALTLVPFPKCIGIKQGSRRVLSSLFPQLRHDAPRFRVEGDVVSYLAPSPEAWPAGPAPVRYVVLPKYVRGAQTALTPVRPSEVLPHLIEQSFSVRDRGLDGMNRVLELVRGAQCYRLTVGDLRAAVDLLRHLAD
jgi:hypothetical protein